MSQYKNEDPANQGRNDAEQQPDSFFSKWLVSMGTAATEGGAGLFGVNLQPMMMQQARQPVMPQALPDGTGPNTNVPTNPVEKFIKGLRLWLKKLGSPRPGAKNRASRGAQGARSTPETNVPTNPTEKSIDRAQQVTT